MPTSSELMTPAVPLARPGDTVGRALAVLRSNRPDEASHLYLLIGATIGGMAGAGLLILDGRTPVAIVVGVIPAATSVVATLVASLLPWGLDRMSVDPALASGPIATVLQDLLSVAIYLSIATAML